MSQATPIFVKERRKVNSKRKFYIEKIALDARNRLIEKRIINEDAKALNFEQLEQIISFYGGELRVSSKQEKPSIRKKSEDEFIIQCNRKNNYLQVLHELGHAFLHLDDMKINEECYYEGYGIEDSEASLFARAFVMPRNDFEKVVIEHLNNGKYTAQNVANEYGIDYFEVLARGEELNIGS